MKDSRGGEIQRNQLVRLERLTDVVYGASLVLIVLWLPRPDESLVAGEVWLGQLFADHLQNLLGILVGLAFVILYWLRSNTLLSALDRTDGVHTGLSIASVFFLLLLLYTVQVGGEVVASSRRAAESVAVALIGVSAAGAWAWASRRQLVRSDMDEAERLNAQLGAFTEPLAALVTLPFAYLGEAWWNLAWLSYLPIAALLRRRGRRSERDDD